MSRRIGVVLLVPALWSAGSTTSAQEPCGVPEDSRPRIEAAAPVVIRTEGATVCACGAFPDPAAVRGLRLDGRPVEASVDAFGRVATLRLPSELAPGVHVLTGDPGAGYSPADRVEIQLVAVEARRCEHFFSCGKHRRVCLTVEGSEEPLALRVRNRNPDLVALALGPAGEVQTSGGSRNRTVLEGRATGAPGRWTLDITPTGPPCPCAAGGAEGLPPARVAELEACLQAAVAEIEAWFDGRARELAARAERGVLTPGEVIALIDELERRLLRVLATPDLAALRAWVEDELARARELWSGRATTETAVPAVSRLSSRGGGLAFASSSLRVVRVQGSTPAPYSDFLDFMSSFFRRLREVSSDLLADLCVRFDSPEDSDRDTEALLWLYPKRYPSGYRTANPDAEIQRLTRGLHCLLVTQPELTEDEFLEQAASGSCRESSRFQSSPADAREKEEEEMAWAQGEADLVREVDRYFTCRTKTRACSKRAVTDPFACDRGNE